MTVEPLHDRERLALPDPSPEKAYINLVQFNAKEEEDGEEVEGNGAVVEDGDGHTMEKGDKAKLEQADPLAQCVLDLPAAAIKTLKSDAGGAYTSFEVICAHFWQRVTAARQAPATEPTAFAVMANCRSRLTPPLPPAYFGNVIMFGEVVCAAGEIRREELAATAGRIHDIVAGCREDTLVALMHWLELHDNRIFPTFKPLGPSINVASSPRFPAYQVDFGWGRPAAVRSVKVQVDGEMVLFGGRPGSDPGDVEICLALSASAMKRLLKDPQFLATPPTNPLWNS